MHNQEPFHHLVTQLLRRMQIELPAQKRNNVYSLTFDQQTDVHLLSPAAGLLDMIADAGTLDGKRSETTLLALLEMNRFQTDRLPLNVSVDSRSGLVSLWLRQSLSVLDLDTTVHALEGVLDGARAARELLTSGAVCLGPVRPAYTTVHMLEALRFHTKIG